MHATSFFSKNNGDDSSWVVDAREVGGIMGSCCSSTCFFIIYSFSSRGKKLKSSIWEPKSLSSSKIISQLTIIFILFKLYRLYHLELLSWLMKMNFSLLPQWFFAHLIHVHELCLKKLLGGRCLAFCHSIILVLSCPIHFLLEIYWIGRLHKQRL